MFSGPITKVSDCIWEIPQSYKKGMRVNARVYADAELLQKMKQDKTMEQTVNVGFLPGVQKYSIALPDGHEGYGFPIGGVAATSYEDGVVSPGGVGFDINCGVRLLTTSLEEKDMRPKLADLLRMLYNRIPSGLGSKGEVHLTADELNGAVVEGVEWAIKRGYGWAEDSEFIEENGRMGELTPRR